MADIINYSMIEKEDMPVFDGIYCRGQIYEYRIREYSNPDSCKHKIAEFLCTSNIIKEEYIPTCLCTTFETFYEEHDLLLECGEASYGSIGFVCLSNKNKNVVFLACFEYSNPFVIAEYKEGKIRAMNNLGEIWTFVFGKQSVPTITIDVPDFYDPYNDYWSKREEW